MQRGVVKVSERGLTSACAAVQGAPSFDTCHSFTIPDAIPRDHELVGVRAVLGRGPQPHHMVLMECPGDLWALPFITRSTDFCSSYSKDLDAACEVW